MERMQREGELSLPCLGHVMHMEVPTFFSNIESGMTFLLISLRLNDKVWDSKLQLDGEMEHKGITTTELSKMLTEMSM